jgi:hypothetical protein
MHEREKVQEQHSAVSTQPITVVESRTVPGQMLIADGRMPALSLRRAARQLLYLALG